MKSAKFKQFALSLLALLSLLASSVSACTCSHHQEKPATENPSCHEHQATKSDQNHDDELPETFQSTVSESGCVCFQTAPKIIVKTENIKVEKHLTAIQAIEPPAIVYLQQTFSVKIDFSKPLYLSDSFYNLSPGRAPPVL